jgi:hypothetical protein
MNTELLNRSISLSAAAGGAVSEGVSGGDQLPGAKHPVRGYQRPPKAGICVHGADNVGGESFHVRAAKRGMPQANIPAAKPCVPQANVRAAKRGAPQANRAAGRRNHDLYKGDGVAVHSMLVGRRNPEGLRATAKAVADLRSGTRGSRHTGSLGAAVRQAPVNFKAQNGEIGHTISCMKTHERLEEWCVRKRMLPTKGRTG